MAKKSSTLLAIMFIVNPIMLLLFQNCSSKPSHTVVEKKEAQLERQAASAAKGPVFK